MNRQEQRIKSAMARLRDIQRQNGPYVTACSTAHGDLTHGTLDAGKTPSMRRTICGREVYDLLGTRFSIIDAWACKNCVRAYEALLPDQDT